MGLNGPRVIAALLMVFCGVCADHLLGGVRGAARSAQEVDLPNIAPVDHRFFRAARLARGLLWPTFERIHSVPRERRVNVPSRRGRSPPSEF